MNEETFGCEAGACFAVTEYEGTVAIHGPMPAAPGSAVDTVEAWRQFRDDIQAGKYDHVGGGR